MMLLLVFAHWYLKNQGGGQGMQAGRRHRYVSDNDRIVIASGKFKSFLMFWSGFESKSMLVYDNFVKADTVFLY